MEALMTLDCSNYSNNILDILHGFEQIGWDIYNTQGEIEYLPVGDYDEYDWRCEVMSKVKLYNIISDKISNNECVGVNLFYSKGSEGVSLIAYSTKQIILSLDINRKIYAQNYTDMAWYLNNIIYGLFNIGIKILSYKIEEYED